MLILFRGFNFFTIFLPSIQIPTHAYVTHVSRLNRKLIVFFMLMLYFMSHYVCSIEQIFSYSFRSRFRRAFCPASVCVLNTCWRCWRWVLAATPGILHILLNTFERAINSNLNGRTQLEKFKSPSAGQLKYHSCV